MMSIWKELKKQWRVMDGIVIAGLIILSFVPYGIFAATQTAVSPDDQLVAVVTINGEEVERFVLSDKTPRKEVTYHPNKNQYNIVEVDGRRIRVKEDNSPDQIAVNTGWISKPGQTSICLPHRLVIEIQSENPDEDEVIITY